MIKVISNVDLKNHSDENISFIYESFIDKKSFDLPLNIKYMKKNKIDAAIFFNPSFKEILFCFFSKFFLGKKSYLFDATLKKPRNLKQKLLCKAKGFLMNCCNKFIVVHKNLSDYYRYYGLDRNKTTYIPFKSNCFEILDNIISTDEGYLLSCGGSHRDYDTLIKAIRGINTKVIIVLPQENEASIHRTKLTTAHIPENVQIIRHNFSRESWYEYLRKSTAVVIPIETECIQPAGISVYLEAMSIGKPTIISQGPSTDDLIVDQALLVPRGDHEALRHAIEKLISDKQLQKELSEKGKSYALSLGGISRLINDIKGIIISDFNTPTL